MLHLAIAAPVTVQDVCTMARTFRPRLGRPPSSCLCKKIASAAHLRLLERLDQARQLSGGRARAGHVGPPGLVQGDWRDGGDVRGRGQDVDLVTRGSRDFGAFRALGFRVWCAGL